MAATPMTTMASFKREKTPSVQRPAEVASSSKRCPKGHRKIDGDGVALAERGDSWVTMSLALGDVVTDTQSHQHDAVLVEVER